MKKTLSNGVRTSIRTRTALAVLLSLAVLGCNSRKADDANSDPAGGPSPIPENVTRRIEELSRSRPGFKLMRLSPASDTYIEVTPEGYPLDELSAIYDAPRELHPDHLVPAFKNGPVADEIKRYDLDHDRIITINEISTRL